MDIVIFQILIAYFLLWNPLPISFYYEVCFYYICLSANCRSVLLACNFFVYRLYVAKVGFNVDTCFMLFSSSKFTPKKHARQLNFKNFLVHLSCSTRILFRCMTTWLLQMIYFLYWFSSAKFGSQAQWFSCDWNL